MLARIRVRQVMKIGPKLNSYPYSHFIEHLVDMFGKQLIESD
jgi:hypothetical protein